MLPRLLTAGLAALTFLTTPAMAAAAGPRLERRGERQEARGERMERQGERRGEHVEQRGEAKVRAGEALESATRP